MTTIRILSNSKGEVLIQSNCTITKFTFNGEKNSAYHRQGTLSKVLLKVLFLHRKSLNIVYVKSSGLFFLRRTHDNTNKKLLYHMYFLVLLNNGIQA